MTAAQSKLASDTAHTAYKELLASPLPTRRQDYLRAIMEAVLIGQVLAAVDGCSSWQTDAPNEAGPWECACYENDFEPERVTIKPHGGELWADVPSFGFLPVRRYHDGLTGIHWRKVSP